MCVYSEKVNSIVLTKEDFGDKLFQTIGTVISVLTQSGYICEVYADEPALGIYVINYDYKDPEFTNNRLLWVDTDKYYVGERDKEDE